MPKLPIPDVLPGSPHPLATRFQTHYAAWLRGLTPDQQYRFIERLEFLQLTTPLTGYRLLSRCAGLKRSVLHGTIGNAAFGRSMLGIRRYMTRLRNGHPLTHFQRRLVKWSAEEQERQRALADRNV